MANTLLQKASAGASPATSKALAYSGNVVAGSLLIIGVAVESSGGALQTLSVSDNLNGAWTSCGTRAIAGGGRAFEWFYFKNSASGACTVTASLSSGSAYWAVSIFEYTVPSPTGVSVENVATNNGNNSPVTTGTVTINGSGRLVLAGFGQGNSATMTLPTISVSSPFSVETSVNNGSTEGMATADDTSGSANEQATFTISGNAIGAWPAMIVSFITQPGTLLVNPGMSGGMQNLMGGIHA